MATGENRGVWEVRTGETEGVTRERDNPLPKLQSFSLWGPQPLLGGGQPNPCPSLLPRPPSLTPFCFRAFSPWAHVSLGPGLSPTILSPLLPGTSPHPICYPAEPSHPQPGLLGPSNCASPSPQHPLIPHL